MSESGNTPFCAVFWDFGGVVTSSPFDAFRSYERAHGLPTDFIRSVNARNPDTNAWARLERNDIDVAGFDTLFEAESAAMGHAVPGAAVLALLSGQVRPEMANAIARLRSDYKLACLTNNVLVGDGPGMASDAKRASEVSAVIEMFDVVLESSKIGVRKPEPRFYEIACERLQVRPQEVVFLDDLGVNLKPARAMGMFTIKVADSRAALAELEAVLGVALS